MKNKMSLAEYHALTQKEAKNKYNAQKGEAKDGTKCDSLAETRRYDVLLWMQEAGLIANLKPHPRFELMPAFKHNGKTVRKLSYHADAMYQVLGVNPPIIVVEDTKGHKTPEYRFKRKLFIREYVEPLGIKFYEFDPTSEQLNEI